MTIKDIYEDFKIPENLQEHMLRVGSLAEIISEGWKGEFIEKGSIVLACLLHDIAKPMSFDLDKQASYGLSTAQIEELASLQKRLRSYGDDEHDVLTKICRELGCEEVVVRILGKFEWEWLPRIFEENDVETLIAIYSDMRIDWNGILPMEDRLKKLKSREAANDLEEQKKNGEHLEKMIKMNVAIDVESITDEEINERFDKLKSLEM